MQKILYDDHWVEAFGDENDLSSWLMNELTRAFYLARKAKRSTYDEQLFEARLTENLLSLRDDILNRNYHPGHGIAFIVHEPVIREIFAAPFRDRVIHHLLYNGVADWWDRRLIYDCYSCRVGKGTLFGIKRLAHHIKSASNGYTEPTWTIKLDISGYFMSLPRKGLYERVSWGLDRQFPNGGPIYDIYKYVWHEIIFDEPTQGVRRRGQMSSWNKLPASKSLFCQPPGKGIVIGNLSSQLLSNIYLDLLDRFIVYDLGYKHYGRYVDDFYLIVKESELEKAKQDIKLIEAFLLDIGLTLHPKKIHIQPIEHGTAFLGAVVYPGRIVPAPRIIKNYTKALKKYQNCRVGDDVIISYMGMMKHINGYRTQQRIFENVGFEYVLPDGHHGAKS
ncbi:RNA-directed DNA polymerase [Candidatus Saccharibacteria bacterium]|nr:RNA-directed DNA polymerase [Candidatus Saccharibacteria bacterium]